MDGFDPGRYDAEVPDGLTRRARSFVLGDGLRIGSLDDGEYRERWLGLGIPAAVMDRVAAFNARWGGLALPPAPAYDGGPRFFCPDTPEGEDTGEWWFEAGTQRTAVPYSFMIGPNDEFGIHGPRWVPLHATVEGWVESLSLAYHARMWARKVTKVVEDEVSSIDLAGFEPVLEVAGMADTWWRGRDSLVAIYAGEAECFSAPNTRWALIYSGLDEWGLHG